MKTTTTRIARYHVRIRLHLPGEPSWVQVEPVHAESFTHAHQLGLALVAYRFPNHRRSFVSADVVA